jgi:purine-nucleoside phosphorylase
MMDYSNFYERVGEAAAFLKDKLPFEPKVVVVLTAGVGTFADDIEDAKTIKLSEIPHFPKAHAEGHKGVIVCGKKNGVPLIAMKGRFHYYEGHHITDVVFPYVVFNKLGATTLVTTNAVGGIHRDFDAGQIVLINDHINLMGTNPLIGLAVQRDHDQFTSLNNAYDEELQTIARDAAKSCGVKITEGVFAAVSGPTYETKAEVRAFRTLGADIVGMSTVPAVIMANFLGMKVLSISIVSNRAADLHGGELSHEEVLGAMNAVGPQVVTLLNLIIGEISKK